ncbi:hypothetical protein, partial [Staphylococcus hyicus]|uniref:hypothetical protein n=1 Tax=Staphylococcus hyicus TaxID=1284 RepID=UPI003736E283
IIVNFYHMGVKFSNVNFDVFIVTMPLLAYDRCASSTLNKLQVYRHLKPHPFHMSVALEMFKA